MAAGRPTTYKPEYCERAVELGKQGKSQVQIAVALDVSRTTMLSWADQHLEFSTALTRAKECEQDWWETAGQGGLTAEKFNATVWTKSMQARFRDDYTERREVAGVADRPIETKEVTTRRDLARGIAFALAAAMNDPEAPAEE